MKSVSELDFNSGRKILYNDRYTYYAMGFVLMGACLLACGCNGIGGAGDAKITFEYTPSLKHPDLMERGLQIYVGQIDVEVNSTRIDERTGVTTAYGYRYNPVTGRVVLTGVSASQGVTETQAKRSGKLWENSLRSQFRDKLQTMASRAGIPVVFVDRDHMRDRLDEQDLASAGITERRPQTKQLGIDLRFVGSLNIDSNTEVTYKKSSTDRVLNVLPGVKYMVDDGPKAYIRRTMTFAGYFKATDDVTGEEWANHAINQQKYQDKKPRPFVDRSTSDLEPQDAEIKKILDQEVQDFVSQLLPTPITVSVLFEASGNDYSKLGLSYMIDRNYSAARSAFESAIAANSFDDKSVFGAGLACEAMLCLTDALNFYRKAVALGGEDVDDPEERNYEVNYQKALNRVSERIRRGEANRCPPRQQTVVLNN